MCVGVGGPLEAPGRWELLPKVVYNDDRKLGLHCYERASPALIDGRGLGGG